MHNLRRLLASIVLLALGACGGIHYDLSQVDFPLYAGPAPDGAAGESFSIKTKSVLWVHGIAGESQPDVVQKLRDLEPGPGGIANLRITQSASFHDWLLTHLSLTLVRMKTVRIEGQIVGAPAD